MVSYTDEQAKAIEAAANLSKGETLLINAFAGAGKTHTLKGIAKERDGHGMYLAFNKSIASEAKMKFAGMNCSASTFHSLALNAVRRYISTPMQFRAQDVLDTGILETVSRPRDRDWNDRKMATAVLRTIEEFCNSADKEMLPKHAEAAIIQMMGDPDFISTRTRRERALSALELFVQPVVDASALWWGHCMEKKTTTHSMYLKVVEINEAHRNVAFHGIDYVLMDEGQDLNQVQRSILEGTGLPIVVVGDSYQSIYAWRKADDALRKMKGEKLYLTQSFRFGDNVASYGRAVLDALPENPPEVRLVGKGPNGVDQAKAGRAIMCRTNMGVLDEALKCISNNEKIYIESISELKDELSSALALKNNKRHLVKGVLQQFSSWNDFLEEADSGLDQNLSRMARIIEDGRVSDVNSLSRMACSEERPDATTISTIHKSKGREWPIVRMGDDCKSIHDLKIDYDEACGQSEEKRKLALEEYNAIYVGLTRAMKEVENPELVLEKPPLSPQPA